MTWLMVKGGTPRDRWGDHMAVSGFVCRILAIVLSQVEQISTKTCMCCGFSAAPLVPIHIYNIYTYVYIHMYICICICIYSSYLYVLVCIDTCGHPKHTTGSELRRVLVGGASCADARTRKSRAQSWVGHGMAWLKTCALQWTRRWFMLKRM